MAAGRKTGGRQKGTTNKKTQAVIDAVEKEGLTPLQFLLKVMRDTGDEMPVRIDAAKAAAPYIHAKLSAVHNTNGNEQTLEEWLDELPEATETKD